jgi:hypothetical protein
MLNFHDAVDNSGKTATFVRSTNNTHTMNTTITNKEKNGNRGYFVYHMGEVFFAIFSYGDGDVEFLSKPYRTQKGADKYLTEYRKQANA